MTKLLGIILLSAGISFYSSYKAACLTKVKNTRALILQLLNSLCDGIKYNRSSLAGMLSDFEKSFSRSNSTLWRFDENDVLRFKALHLLDSDEKALLNEFFHDFGKSPCSQQELERSLYYFSKYEKMKKCKDEKCNNSIFLYKRAGVIFALLAAIIFI